MVHRGLNQKTETMANTGDPGKVFPHCICISLACIALKQHSGVGGIIRPCLARSCLVNMMASSLCLLNIYIYIQWIPSYGPSSQLQLIGLSMVFLLRVSLTFQQNIFCSLGIRRKLELQRGLYVTPHFKSTVVLCNLMFYFTLLLQN